MSLEKALREMVRNELALQLSPLRMAVGRMTEGLESLAMLRALGKRLDPLASRLGAMAGLRNVAVPAARQEAPARGRPPQAARGRVAPAEAKRPRAAAEEEGRACAIKGCDRPARSKGYCSAHYQKLRLLIKTNRRPADWVDDARPQSARDMKLPRGRAAQGREAAPAQPTPPAAPPKAKAWLRKKGAAGMVSLN